MGTAIQKYNLNEEIYMGKKGFNEILNFTASDIIKKIHRDYIEAGADIIETNSFSANSFTVEKYKFNKTAYEIAKKSANLAKEVANKFKRKIFIAGSVGSMSRSLFLEDELDFDIVKQSYKEQIKGLIDGGVDFLLIETVYDGLNAKAAVVAAEEVKEGFPIILSATLNKQGKLLTGQSLESLIVALDRKNLIAFGANCSFGAKDLVKILKNFEKFSKKPIILYPNAGLPNSFGEYEETPEKMIQDLKELLDNKMVNIIGGCCGTTKEHIKALKNYIKEKKGREFNINCRLDYFFSGNEIYNFKKRFSIIGERNSIPGSKIFKEAILNKDYEKAMDIAREEIRNGANLIDINMDDGILDSKKEMIKYLKLIQKDKEISKVPIMIDSSDFEIIESAMKIVSGKGIINSISLKDGEEEFKRKAKIIKKYGFGVIVMAFDEKGQATIFERKKEILERSYKILKNLKFKNKEIFVDSNILVIGTGIESDRYNAIEFFRTCKWCRENLKCNISGGISNISFAFRGNNILRYWINKIFLKEAKKYGLNFAIMNPNEKYKNLNKNKEKIIKDFIFGNVEALDKIINMKFNNKTIREKSTIIETLEEKIEHYLLEGKFIDKKDIEKILLKYSPLDLIEKVFMKGMTKLGILFENGEVYLPQLLNSSKVMEKALEMVLPHLDKVKNKEFKGKILMATVAGDVHDIGKNIVGSVLKCNGYDIIDLGVMVEKHKILENVKKHKIDIVTLSGLITPSLKEMEEVLKLFEKNKMNTIFLISGATTSEEHTNLKLKPLYSGKVYHVTDAVSTLKKIQEVKK